MLFHQFIWLRVAVYLSCGGPHFSLSCRQAVQISVMGGRGEMSTGFLSSLLTGFTGSIFSSQSIFSSPTQHFMLCVMSGFMWQNSRKVTGTAIALKMWKREK